MDVTQLDIPPASFDAAVATFLFCVLTGDQQVPALLELRRVVRPGGSIRLLEYVQPRSPLRRLSAAVWEPWVAWAYGAGFDRNTAAYVPEAGLELVEARFVVDELMQLLAVRVPRVRPEPRDRLGVTVSDREWLLRLLRAQATAARRGSAP